VTSRLTAADRELIATARELAAPDSAVGLRHYLRKRGHDLEPRRATHEFVYRAGFLAETHRYPKPATPIRPDTIRKAHVSTLWLEI
jgi:hypothetical protein